VAHDDVVEPRRAPHLSGCRRRRRTDPRSTGDLSGPGHRTAPADRTGRNEWDSTPGPIDRGHEVAYGEPDKCGESRAPLSRPSAAPSPGRNDFDARLPFGFHQAVEYLGGLFLASNAAHLGAHGAVVCFTAGMAMVLMAALSGRPLGAGPLPRPLHRFADLALVAALPAAPFALHFGHDLAGVIVVESLAVLMIVVVKHTNYDPRRPRARPVRPTPRATPRPIFTEETLAATARSAGIMAKKLKAHGPRAAGRMLGRLRARRRQQRAGQ
jgi:hypothetical protein